MLPAIQNNLYGFWPRENCQPFYNRASHKMRLIGFGDQVTAFSHDNQYYDAGASGTAFPRWSVGTINAGIVN
jgi:hypothetical protein